MEGLKVFFAWLGFFFFLCGFFGMLVVLHDKRDDSFSLAVKIAASALWWIPAAALVIGAVLWLCVDWFRRGR